MHAWVCVAADQFPSQWSEGTLFASSCSRLRRKKFASPQPTLGRFPVQVVAAFELYRRYSIGMCLTETLDEMVSSGTLKLAIQVLVQFDKSMTEALENQVKSKSKVTVKSCWWNLEEEEWGITGEEGDDAILCGCSNPNIHGRDPR